MNSEKHFTRAALALATVALAGQAFAVEIARDDFDAAREFLTYSTSPVDPGLNGLFNSGASRFDRWGIANRTLDDTAGPGSQGLPFDVVDETILAAAGSTGGVFPPDDKGILKSTDLSNVFIVGDLQNDINMSGTGSATWTFDVSGFNNLSVSLDMAAIGAFEDTDVFQVIAQVDSNPVQIIMNGTANDGVQYTVEMEGGITYDRYESPFWGVGEDAIWNFMVTNPGLVPFMNGSDTIDWCSCDADFDGLDDVSGERAFEETNSNGTFDERERELYQNPMSVNGVDLNNDFQTITAPITASGSTLTLTFSATQNGSLEFFVMDNLVIEGDEVGSLAGDYDFDGDVDVADALEGQRQGVDLNGDWASDFPTGELPVSAVGAVPEPTTLALLGLASCLLARRQRG